MVRPRRKLLRQASVKIFRKSYIDNVLFELTLLASSCNCCNRLWKKNEKKFCQTLLFWHQRLVLFKSQRTVGRYRPTEVKRIQTTG